MKTTNFVGLTDKASQHIESNINNSRTNNVYDQETAKKMGIKNDGPDLYEYTMKDNTKLKEIVQSAPITKDGISIFLCLQDSESNRLFEWSKEDIIKNQ